VSKTAVRSLAFTVLALAALSCTETRDSVAPGRYAAVHLEPKYVATGVAAERAPLQINRIRLTATVVGTGRVLETATRTVNPSDDEWQLDFPIPVPDEQVSVIVTIELINLTNGVESVEWSGQAGPFLLTVGEIGGGTPVQVPVFRGPATNLGVTSVSVTPLTSSIIEGSTTTLNAALGGAGSGAVVFWTSLDPDKASVSDAGVVLGLLPGTARIVATVGSHSDTVTVTITVKVQTVTVTPANPTLTSFGAQQQFTAQALDPRGAPITPMTFAFSSSNTAVATHQGNGLMRAVGNGTTTVTATASSQNVSGTTTLTVQQAAALVVVSGTQTIATIGGTTQFTAVARDANGNNLTTQPTITWETSAASVATVNATSGLVTAVSNGTATITARVSATLFGTRTVTVGGATGQNIFQNGFETGDAAWTPAGTSTNAGVANVANTAFPTCISAAGSDASGRSPAAPQGTRYGWLASLSSGNYLGAGGTCFSGDGGTSAARITGQLTSPNIVVPAGQNSLFLSFRSWFEIESQEITGHDLMQYEILDAGTNQVLLFGQLNDELSNPDVLESVPTTSGGVNAAPVFVLRTAPAANLGGKTVKIVFLFDSVDELYNGFRGWVVDDVRLGTVAPTSLVDGAGGAGGAQMLQPQCSTAESCAALKNAPPPTPRRKQ